MALENPCYPPIRQGLLSQGANILNCEVDDEGMQLPGARVKMAWMTPARQYPLGISQSTERRLEWLAYCKQQKCWLVEDDYDSEFYYLKMPLAPLCNLASKLPSNEQRIILVGSLSKVMFRTLRIGYLIVPESLVEPMLAAQESLGTMSSVPIQPALADFLSHRQFVTHLRGMRSLYRRRRDFLYELIQQELGGYVTCVLPYSGMNLLAYFRSNVEVSDTWLEQRLKPEGIHALALSSHYDRIKGKRGLLLGFSGSSEDNLKIGVERLKQLLDNS